MSYPLSCLLPENATLFFNESTHQMEKLSYDVSQEEWDSKLEDYLSSGRIILYLDNFETRSLSYQDVGSMFHFQYFPFLKFLYEKDLRNLWLNEIIPHESEEDGESSLMAFDVSTLNEETRLKEIERKMSDGFIHYSLSIRNLGIVDGVDVGHGLFAEEIIAAGTILGEYTGLVCYQQQGEKKVGDDHLAYCCEYPSCDGGLMINALEIGNVMRFINHSAAPNAIFQRCYFSGVGHILCVSTYSLFDTLFYSNDYRSLSLKSARTNKSL